MNKLLIVVDFQKDFVNGALGFAKAKELDLPISKKIEEYRSGDDQIVFTYDTHTDDYLKTCEGKWLPVKHCIEKSEGWQLYGEVGKKLDPNDKVFIKGTFGSDKLFDYLRQNQYSQIELCGLISNICVISNAVLAKTAQPETPIIVDKTCVMSFDEYLNKAALDVMQSLHITIL